MEVTPRDTCVRDVGARVEQGEMLLGGLDLPGAKLPVGRLLVVDAVFRQRRPVEEQHVEVEHEPEVEVVVLDRQLAVVQADRVEDAPRHENRRAHAAAVERRSEEHTSELQSPCNLVCRLLLEKKNKNKA